MRFPCMTAARRFDAHAHVAFWIGGERVGWLRSADVPFARALARRFSTSRPVPAARASRCGRALDSVGRRSEALGVVIGALARRWTDSRLARRDLCDPQRIRRAAARVYRAARRPRFFGTMTYAAHLNGIVECAADGPRSWIARPQRDQGGRSGHVRQHGGGRDRLGLRNRGDAHQGMLGRGAAFRRTSPRTRYRGARLTCFNRFPEGTQAEQIFVYDLTLPADFVPRIPGWRSERTGSAGEHRRHHALDRRRRDDGRCVSRDPRLPATPDRGSLRTPRASPASTHCSRHLPDGRQASSCTTYKTNHASGKGVTRDVDRSTALFSKLSCGDRPGIVHAVSGFLFERGQQHSRLRPVRRQPYRASFFMRVHFQQVGGDPGLDALRQYVRRAGRTVRDALGTARCVGEAAHRHHGVEDRTLPERPAVPSSDWTASH